MATERDAARFLFVPPCEIFRMPLPRLADGSHHNCPDLRGLSRGRRTRSGAIVLEHPTWTLIPYAVGWTYADHLSYWYPAGLMQPNDFDA